MRAAVQALRQQRPARIVVAVPVAPDVDLQELRGGCRRGRLRVTPDAVHSRSAAGTEDFSQTTDEEVRDAAGATSRPRTGSQPGADAPATCASRPRQRHAARSAVRLGLRPRSSTWIGDARFVLHGRGVARHARVLRGARAHHPAADRGARASARSPSRPTGRTPTASTATCAGQQRRHRCRGGAARASSASRPGCGATRSCSTSSSWLREPQRRRCRDGGQGRLLRARPLQPADRR